MFTTAGLKPAPKKCHKYKELRMDLKELIKLIEERTGFTGDAAVTYALSLVWTLSTTESQQRVFNVIKEYNPTKV
jgi:hypothetical protein